MALAAAASSGPLKHRLQRAGRESGRGRRWRGALALARRRRRRRRRAATKDAGLPRRHGAESVSCRGCHSSCALPSAWPGSTRQPPRPGPCSLAALSPAATLGAGEGGAGTAGLGFGRRRVIPAMLRRPPPFPIHFPCSPIYRCISGARHDSASASRALPHPAALHLPHRAALQHRVAAQRHNADAAARAAAGIGGAALCRRRASSVHTCAEHLHKGQGGRGRLDGSTAMLHPLACWWHDAALCCAPTPLAWRSVSQPPTGQAQPHLSGPTKYFHHRAINE